MDLEKNKYKGISRIDQDTNHTHGWYVRVWFNGKMYSKFFSDEKNGGGEKALTKALRHRNRLEKEIGKPRTDRKVVTYSSKNKTGVVGVVRKVKEGREVYEVNWNPIPGVIKRTSVSIDRYGEEKAFLKAYRIRKKKEKEIYGKSIDIKAEKTMSC
ncbi:MAG: AP2 domain-containing protein [Blastocatellia bacterium]|nr:AP2 domain-containing protein [Blastocatellia bacterium]MBL8196198.1 AP2 domain-containing protein [Blastocatellia bacterium]MBN8724106.1 AP2 domain-containing protein [Acidobacteriota bacterium]